VAFKFNLRRYNVGGMDALEHKSKTGDGLWSNNNRKFDLAVLRRERHKYSLRDYLAILYPR
jgi:hypothetical protein